MEDPSINGKIILKCILKKQDVWTYNYFMQLRIGASGSVAKMASVHSKAFPQNIP
jgi:hypothetical protein